MKLLLFDRRLKNNFLRKNIRTFLYNLVDRYVSIFGSSEKIRRESLVFFKVRKILFSIFLIVSLPVLNRFHQMSPDFRLARYQSPSIMPVSKHNFLSFFLIWPFFSTQNFTFCTDLRFSDFKKTNIYKKIQLFSAWNLIPSIRSVWKSLFVCQNTPVCTLIIYFFK